MSAAWCAALLAGDYAAVGYTRDAQGILRDADGIEVVVRTELSPVMALPPEYQGNPYDLVQPCASPHAAVIGIPGGVETPDVVRRKARAG